tara:strand:- start:207 stop:425 length:219 start_codon:yes stop_codon:yes gene_type:complete
MNRLLYIFLLVMLFGCETGQIINNAKPKTIDPEPVNNIAIAAETATRTWIPWYILLVILLVVITIRVWNKKD